MDEFFERLEQRCIKKGRSCWAFYQQTHHAFKKYEKLIYRGVHLRYCGLTAWTDNGSALSLSLSHTHTHTISLTHSSRLLSLSPIASHDLCQSEDSKEILNFLLLVKSRRNRRKMKRQDVCSKQLRDHQIECRYQFRYEYFFPRDYACLTLQLPPVSTDDVILRSLSEHTDTEQFEIGRFSVFFHHIIPRSERK